MRKTILLTAFALLSASCGGSGPEVDVCLSFPEKGGFICVDRKQKPYFKDYKETLKYVAFNPADAQKLIEACGISSHEKALVRSYLHHTEIVAMRSESNVKQESEQQ